VFQKRLDALLAAQIPQRLETLGAGVDAGQAGERERGDRAASRSEPESHGTKVMINRRDTHVDRWYFRPAQTPRGSRVPHRGVAAASALKHPDAHRVALG
jgi:hypothetical protein